MTDLPPRALLLVPGDLATPTGGYGYARRLLTAAAGEGFILRHWPLPGGFPRPAAAAIAETERRLCLLPVGWPAIIDGLALGVLPPQVIEAAGTPVIALCHHPLGFETGLTAAEAAPLLASERAALATCAAVITTSETTAVTLREHFHVDPARITVAQPGTDPAPQARGSGGATPRLLAIGSLTPRKGHDVLIAALATLSDLDWRLTVHGPAPDQDYRDALMARVVAAGLGDRIALEGPADADTLATAYDQADVFVLASRYEGYGMAYTEALARGLPVVGCATGAVAEATRGAACLVPPDAPEALAEALRPLIVDRAARERLAARSRIAAAELPGWGETAAAVAGAVAAVLAGQRA
ncbi:MAG: glycosyltransferase family 4 protein [Pikeienuella sp.]